MEIALPTQTSATLDRHLLLQGGWAQFQLIQQGCEQSPGVRLSYFAGTIEILMPGQPHEQISHAIGQLLTLYLAHQGVLFYATGSADQTQDGIVTVQADQSYCFGSLKPIPDLAIEVVFTSGGVNKLRRYQALGVPEVWFWQNGSLSLYHLRVKGYEPITQSELAALKPLDLRVLERHITMAEADLGEAIRLFMQQVLA